MTKRLSALEAVASEIMRQVQPNISDGGLFSYFEKEDPLLNRRDNFFGDFLKKCNEEKGHYKLWLIIGGVWAFFLALLLLIYFLYRLCKKVCFSRQQNKTTKKPQDRSLKAVLCVVFILLLIFSSAVLLSWVADVPLRSALDEPSSPSSARGILNQSLNAFERFVNRGLSEGRNTTTVVIDDFTRDLQGLIHSAVTSFIDRLLKAYGVKQLFATAKRVTDDIQNVLDAMKHIKQSQNNVFVKYSEFNGFVNTYRDLLKEHMEKVCDLIMSNSQKEKCKKLKEQRSELEINIQQSKINFDSSTSLLFILKEMKVNITSIIVSVEQANSSMQEDLGKVYSSIQKDFNLNAIFGSLDNVWDMLINSSNDMLLTPMKQFQNGKSLYIIRFYSF